MQKHIFWSPSLGEIIRKSILKRAAEAWLPSCFQQDMVSPLPLKFKVEILRALEDDASSPTWATLTLGEWGGDPLSWLFLLGMDSRKSVFASSLRRLGKPCFVKRSAQPIASQKSCMSSAITNAQQLCIKRILVSQPSHAARRWYDQPRSTTDPQ